MTVENGFALDKNNSPVVWSAAAETRNNTFPQVYPHVVDFVSSTLFQIDTNIAELSEQCTKRRASVSDWEICTLKMGPRGGATPPPPRETSRLDSAQSDTVGRTGTDIAGPFHESRFCWLRRCKQTRNYQIEPKFLHNTLFQRYLVEQFEAELHVTSGMLYKALNQGMYHKFSLFSNQRPCPSWQTVPLDIFSITLYRCTTDDNSWCSFENKWQVGGCFSVWQNHKIWTSCCFPVGTLVHVETKEMCLMIWQVFLFHNPRAHFNKCNCWRRVTVHATLEEAELSAETGPRYCADSSHLFHFRQEYVLNWEANFHESNKLEMSKYTVRYSCCDAYNLFFDETAQPIHSKL